MFRIHAGRNRSSRWRKFLTELQFAQIPSILVLNKADLVERETVVGDFTATVSRRRSRSGAISATDQENAAATAGKARARCCRRISVSPNKLRTVSREPHESHKRWPFVPDSRLRLAVPAISRRSGWCVLSKFSQPRTRFLHRLRFSRSRYGSASLSLTTPPASPKTIVKARW